MKKNDKENTKNQINKLIYYRETIIDNLANIQQILMNDFPKEYEIAYQFWIPQIVTALYEHNNWLQRGEKNMQQTIDRLMNSITDTDNAGVSKYII